MNVRIHIDHMADDAESDSDLSRLIESQSAREAPRAKRITIRKVLVIDDHSIVLQGSRRILEDAGISDIRLVANLTEGFRSYRDDRPDLIFIDLAIKKGGLAGLAFIRRLRLHDKNIPIVVFTMHDDPMIASHALRLGADGYILKDTPSQDIIAAIREVSEGRVFLSHSIASAIAVMETRASQDPFNQMTFRELQTLELIAQGKHYDAIADELNLSYRTIANTCSNIKSKLGVSSLSALTRIAVEKFPKSSGRRFKK